MLLKVKCPNCPNEVNVPPSASLATCPKCLTTFRAAAAEEEEAAAAADAGHAEAHSSTRAHASVPDADEQEDGDSAWISPWGSAAFGVAALALVQGALVGLWWLTVALCVVGLLLVGQGVRATRKNCRSQDRVWFGLGGGLSGAVLLVALFAPGLLNNWWAIDAAVPKSDPDALVLVERDKPLEEGRRASAEDSAQAVSEGIRQEDLFVRVESVKTGPLPGKADGTYLLIHLRLSNCKHVRTIAIDGFDKDNHVPVLTDEAGRSHTFVEQRPRKPAKGAPVFVAGGPKGAVLKPTERQDYLLVFAAPARVENLKLEVPASAWGRKGMCKLRIAGLFEAPVRKTL